MHLDGTIPLPGVEGRIDHLAIDTAGQRLFAAALGNNTVEVLDLKARTRVLQLRDLPEPQGVLFVPAADRLFVSCGGDGTVHIYNGTSLQRIQILHVGEDADNLRLDATAQQVYVGFGSGGLRRMSADGASLLTIIKLSGHPESFQLESSGPRIFVNIPDQRQVAVVDRDTQAALAVWSLKDSLDLRGNFPMALDETHHRLFIGCRHPARLAVFDTETGKRLTVVPCVGDADDIFYDAASSMVLVSGGEGRVDVFDAADTTRISLRSQISTAAGARTSLFAPETSTLYVAVPHRGNQPAEIRIYRLIRT